MILMVLAAIGIVWAVVSSFLNKWTNFVGFYKPGVYMKLYQNGILVAEKTNLAVPSSIVYNAAVDPAVIGRSVRSQSHFNGTIDEVRIYNRSLSPQEVYYLYKYN